MVHATTRIGFPPQLILTCFDLCVGFQTSPVTKLNFLQGCGSKSKAMKFQGGTCKLTSCSEEDLKIERIGFHAAVKTQAEVPAANPHVYNCQPLSFEDMTPSQQQLFVDIVT